MAKGLRVFLDLVGIELCRVPALIALTFSLLILADHRALVAASGPGETYLMIVAVCPPGTEGMEPALCHETTDRAAARLQTSLAVAPDKVNVLVDESASGTNVMHTLKGYADTLTPSDNLIVLINTHGGTFDTWSRALIPDPAIRAIAGGGLPGETYTMQFWRDAPMGLPASALSNRDLVAFDDILAAIDDIDAHVGLIIESCYAGLAEPAVAAHGRPGSLDLLVVSSGALQLSHLNQDRTVSLYSDALGLAVTTGGPTFGDALDATNNAAVERATALCRSLDVTTDSFAKLLPDHPVPQSYREDGSVNLPDWFCIQQPHVTDYSGVISSLPLV